MSKQQVRVFPAQYPDGDEMICDQASVRSQQQNDHHLVTIPVEEIETNFAEILGKSLRPLLLSFKFIGIYYGQTKFETCSLGDDSRKFSSKYSFEKIYCVFVLMVICSSLVAGIITLSYHEYYDINRLFITISHCVWFMHTNFNVLACLALLPCGARKSSRFQKLLFHRFTVYVSGRTAKLSLVSKTLVFAWFFIIANLAMILLFDIFTNVSLIKLPPWNSWPFASLVVHNIMNIYNMSVWILPLVFYVIFCKQLSLLFDNLKTAVSLKVEQGTLTFKSLRHKHEKLCGLVEAADKVLSSIAISIYAGHVPMTCLLFNQLTKFDYGEKNEVLVLVSYLSWGSISVAIVSLVSYFAAVVNSKVSCSSFPQKNMVKM